jgi:dihydrofolate reductase
VEKKATSSSSTRRCRATPCYWVGSPIRAKFVVSTTLEDPEWNNTTVIKGHVAEEVAKLKQRPGGDIVIHGSAQLVQALLEDDLIDEYRLMVFPIVLGRGKRLFRDTGKATTLKLVDSKTVGAGVLILTYQPA